jgi:hypothetical protein
MVSSLKDPIFSCMGGHSVPITRRLPGLRRRLLPALEHVKLANLNRAGVKTDRRGGRRRISRRGGVRRIGLLPRSCEASTSRPRNIMAPGLYFFVVHTIHRLASWPKVHRHDSTSAGKQSLSLLVAVHTSSAHLERFNAFESTKVTLYVLFKLGCGRENRLNSPK